MPIYLYQCRTCGGQAHSSERGSSLGACRDPHCTGELKRKYQLQLVPPMQEHYNPSVNKPISSMRQLNDEFKRASDEYSERTGIEARFAPISPSEVGATNEGLDSTNARRRAQGLREVWHE